MRVFSVREVAVEDDTSSPATAPKRRLRPWRLAGLIFAAGVSVAAWLCVFWAIGYYL